MSKKNPYAVVRGVATTIGYTLLAGLALLIFGGATIANVEEYGLGILWQIPLALVVFVGIVWLIGTTCEKIAKSWRKAEDKWDRQKREESK